MNNIVNTNGCYNANFPLYSAFESLFLAINKYLSEFDTEVKREKARLNLGIKSLKKFWGDLEGSIDDLKDLIERLELIMRKELVDHNVLQAQISIILNKLDNEIKNSITLIKEDLEALSDDLDSVNKDLQLTKEYINNLKNELLEMINDIQEALNRLKIIDITKSGNSLNITKIDGNVITFTAVLDVINKNRESLSNNGIVNLEDYALVNEVKEALDNKVDKEFGKGLSTNDYINADKNKLAGIETGALVNIQSDWTETNVDSGAFLRHKPNLNLKEDKANKVSSWSSVPNNTNYPTEKLVKDSLDLKSDRGHIHSISDITNLLDILNSLNNSILNLTNRIETLESCCSEVNNTLIDHENRIQELEKKDPVVTVTSEPDALENIKSEGESVPFTITVFKDGVPSTEYDVIVTTTFPNATISGNYMINIPENTESSSKTGIINVSVLKDGEQKASLIIPVSQLGAIITYTLETRPDMLINETANSYTFNNAIEVAVLKNGVEITEHPDINFNADIDFVTVIPSNGKTFTVDCTANSKGVRYGNINFFTTIDGELIQDSVYIWQEAFKWKVNEETNISSEEGTYEIPIDWEGALNAAGVNINDIEWIKSASLNESERKILLTVDENNSSDNREGFISIFNNPEVEPYANIKVMLSGKGVIMHLVTLNTINCDLNYESGLYPEETTLNLKATPKPDYENPIWEGDITGTGSEKSIVVTKDLNITCTCSKIKYTITTEGEGCTVSEGGIYEKGTQVTLNASITAGYENPVWYIDGIQVSSGISYIHYVSKNCIVKCVCTKKQFTLNIEKINCDVTKEPNLTLYNYGDNVTLTAIPNAGYENPTWSGDITGTGTIKSIAVTKNINVTCSCSKQSELSVIPNRLNFNSDGTSKDGNVSNVSSDTSWIITD